MVNTNYEKPSHTKIYFMCSKLKKMSRTGEAKALYKALLRAAQMLPVENKRSLAFIRIKEDFRCFSFNLTHHRGQLRIFNNAISTTRASRSETDENTLNDLFLVGYTQLETLSIQVFRVFQNVNPFP